MEKDNQKIVFHIHQTEGQINISQDQAQIGATFQKDLTKKQSLEIPQKSFPFQAHRKQIKTMLMKLHNKSQFIDEINKNLDQYLLLGDRILAVCQEDLIFHSLPSLISKQLSNIEDQIDVASNWQSIRKILTLWMSVLYWLMNAKKEDQLAKKQVHSYSFLVESLQLLTSKELARTIEEGVAIEDIIKQFVWWMQWESPQFKTPFQETNQFIPLFIHSLFAPLIQQCDLIHTKLQGLIISPLSDSYLTTLIKTVSSERAGHLKHFAARKQWLAVLKQKLQEVGEEQKYLLLTGGEGAGKSALCSQLTEELISSVVLLGSQSERVSEQSPWLPTALLHLGKQSNQPDEIVKSLVLQANTLLTNPIYIQEIEAPVSTDLRSDRLKSQNSYLEKYRLIFYQVCERLIQERGEVIIFLDALDEVSPEGAELDFLPKTLPIGAKILLTARSNTNAEYWLHTNRLIESIRLDYLSRAEIPKVTQLLDRKGTAEWDFHNQIWQKSAGWPLLVSAISRDVRKNTGEISEVKIEGNVHHLFRRRAAEWENDPVLKEVLALLTIFDLVAPLDFMEVQGYLEQRDIYLDQPEFYQKLKPVGYQIEGLDESRIKLRVQAFAAYIREKHYTKRDLRRQLRKMAEWLVADDEVSVSILAGFLHVWSQSSMDAAYKSRELIADCLQKFIHQGRAETLYQLAEYWQNKGIYSSLGNRCLQLAAESGNVSAMVLYGTVLIEGNQIKQNIKQGEKWLREAVDKNNALAMGYLGERLIVGNWTSKNIHEGERLLRKAVDLGSTWAMATLGARFLDGNEIARNPKEGEWLLRTAALDGDAWAMSVLGNRLMEGNGVSKNEEEAEVWLRRACNAGNRSTMAFLGVRLLDGDGVKQNRIEGEKLLKQAVEIGSRWAMALLGDRMIDGNGIKQDQTKGEKMLRKAVEYGNGWAMATLGNRLLDGNGVNENQKEGHTLLRKSANLGSRTAMLHLGERLLDGNGVDRNQEEGEEWLRRVALSGEKRAMIILGNRLIQGNGINKDEVEGEYWLNKSKEW